MNAVFESRLLQPARIRMLALLLLGMQCLPIRAVEVDDARKLFLSGQYAASTKMAKQALEEYGNKEVWQLMLLRSLLATGQYREALVVTTNALSHNSWSVQLRWAAREVFLANGQPLIAEAMVDEVINTVSAQPRAYREPLDMLTFGQAAIIKGADPKRVLDTVYESVKKGDPKLRDLYLAAGQLALDKHDYALAAKKFEEGLKVFPDDPDLHFGMAQAFAPSDTELTRAAVSSALERNSNHVGCLLLLIDHCIDAEDYDQAEKVLGQVEAVNPWHPDAWAYRSVVAHFRNQPVEEQEARLAGLKFWPTNPRVDHLIGMKLSQHYRFTEGAAAQRRALTFDPQYLPAKAQLAQDLLRLGDEVEGWLLAEEVHRADGYDVEAYNLTTLRGAIKKFTTLTNEHFQVRMSGHEAAVYGQRVLRLLDQARSTLSAKYEVQPPDPVLVEIFPEQKDFAVRTFGIPGNAGYLGVCFGSVITANSPASHTANRVNWEAVLWHEFCHVITLGATRNKMPRWLSEGISVYEEIQANPAWGQKMNPRYREMILEGELTPVSKLSGAFLSPESDLHLQFAYYESSLVVEYLVSKFGISKLRGILRDLAAGEEVNSTIEKHTAPMQTIEAEFAAFASDRAKSLAPGLDWERPDSTDPLAEKNGASSKRVRVTDVIRQAAGEDLWEDWKKTRPTNFWVMTRKADELVRSQDWTNAKPVLVELVRLYPDFTGDDSPYRALAAAHRALGETNQEKQVLTKFASKDDTALDAYARLMELGAAGKEWPTVLENAGRYIAVNPLVAEPYRFLSQAAEATQNLKEAISARRALVQLDPIDPADAHFRLAQLLREDGKVDEARREVLMALEEAPRYRAALRLLKELNQARRETSGT